MRTKAIILAIMVNVLGAMSKGTGNPGTALRAQHSLQRVPVKGLEVMERKGRPRYCRQNNWWRNKCLEKCKLCSDHKACEDCCKRWCKEVLKYDVWIVSAEKNVTIRQMKNGEPVKIPRNPREAPCPPGWTEKKTGCYKVFFPADTIRNAKDICMKQGGHLADVTSRTEHNILSSFYKDKVNDDVGFWLGAKYKKNVGWIWINSGTSMTFNAWGAEQPGNEKYAMARPKEEGGEIFEWVTTTGSTTGYVICEISADTSCATRGGPNSMCKYLQCDVFFGYCNYWINYCCCDYQGVACPNLCNTGQPCPETPGPPAEK